MPAPTTAVPAAALSVLVLLIVLVAAVTETVATVLGTGDTPSPVALADIPPDYLTLYRAAATTCPGLGWAVLAAVGKIETDHGRLDAPGVSSGENSAGAGGPMQFLAPTFRVVTATHPPPPGGATPPSRYNPHDAVYTAAAYLCGNGAGQGEQGLRRAVFAYNHSAAYVEAVFDRARAYAAAPARNAGGDCNALAAASPAALAAINYACGQRGLPYLWGGNGPDGGDTGFDCSGLTTAAYTAAGIILPRTAATQYRAGPRVPDDEPLLPGDLVFYGTPARIHHVGIYLGQNLMIDAPDVGKVVRIEPYRYNGDDYAGATRPAAASAPSR